MQEDSTYSLQLWIAERQGRWLELSVFHIMLPVYVLPEHFPSKSQKNHLQQSKQTFTDGTDWKRNEGLTNEMLPMIVKSAKVFDSLF